MNFELMAVLLDENCHVILTQSYALSHPVTILSPKITQFSYISNNTLENGKVPVGSPVTVAPVPPLSTL